MAEGSFVERVRAAKWRTPIAIALIVLVLVIAVVLAAAFSKGTLDRAWIASIAFALIAVDLVVFFGSPALALVASILAFASVSGAQVADLLPNGPRDKDVAYCPGPGPEREFSGRVFEQVPKDGAAVREEANTQSDIVERYSANCKQNFESWCIGEVRKDLALKTPDAIWYELSSGKGLMASATVKVREPPVHLDFSRCPGARPPAVQPRFIEPRRPKVDGEVALEAEAPRAPFVGFVAYFADKPGSPESATWHFVAQDFTAADGFTGKWQTRAVPGRRDAAQPAVLAAVPCYAAGVPAEIQAVFSVRVGSVRRHERAVAELTPSGSQLAAGRAEACRFQES